MWMDLLINIFTLPNEFYKLFQFSQKTVRLYTALGHHLTCLNTIINNHINIYFWFESSPANHQDTFVMDILYHKYRIQNKLLNSDIIDNIQE